MRKSISPGSALIAALLAAGTILAYAPVLDNDFICLDDGKYVTGNSRVAGGFSRAAIVWAFTTFHAANWHPLTWLSHIADYRLFGLQPRGHHLTSLLLHVANVLLLFFVLRALTGSRWRSGLTAALFAVHPVHVESVAWVAERKDLLCGFFWILALGAHAGYARRPGWRRGLLTALVFALGLMSKPMLVTLPFLLLLLDYWPLGRLGHARPRGPRGGRAFARRALPLLLEKTPLFILAAASCAVTVVAQRQGGMIKSLEDYPLGVRLANAGMTYLGYLAKILHPASLGLPYPHPGSGIPPLQAVAAALAILGLGVGAAMIVRRHPQALVGWLWFLGALVPVIGLVQVADQAMADRYLYLPLLGLLVLAVWSIPARAGGGATRPAVVLACGLPALLILGVLTRRQARYWHDDISLFGRTIRVTAENPLARYNLGTGLARRGLVAEAVPQFQEALRIRPDFAEAHYNLGKALEELGRDREAVLHYEEAVRIMPDYLYALHNLGGVLIRLQRLPEAVAIFERALRLAPEDPELQFGLGAALALQGKSAGAARRFQEALRIAPGHAEAFKALQRLQPPPAQ